MPQIAPPLPLDQAGQAAEPAEDHGWGGGDQGGYDPGMMGFGDDSDGDDGAHLDAPLPGLDASHVGNEAAAPTDLPGGWLAQLLRNKPRPADNMHLALAACNGVLLGLATRGCGDSAVCGVQASLVHQETQMRMRRSLWTLTPPWTPTQQAAWPSSP